jgi:hypothetical protein
MKLQLALKAIYIWFGLLVLAFMNGAIREGLIKQVLGINHLLAHQISVATGILLWTIFILYIWKKLGISTLLESILVGLIWFLATIIFETFILNRLMGNLSWDQILQTYNLLAGELWIIALLYIGFLPIAVFNWRVKQK